MLAILFPNARGKDFGSPSILNTSLAGFLGSSIYFFDEGNS